MINALRLSGDRPRRGTEIDPDSKKMWVIAAQTGGAVAELTICVVAGLWGGQAVGRLWGYSDIGLLLGGLVGFLSGAMVLWRLVKRTKRDDQ